MSDDDRKLMANITPFGLRMQPALKARIEEAARANNRSLNAEIVSRLEGSFSPAVHLPPDLWGRLDIEAMVNERSVSAEVIDTLERIYPPQPTTKDMIESLDQFLDRVEDLDLFEDAQFKPRLMERIRALNSRLAED